MMFIGIGRCCEAEQRGAELLVQPPGGGERGGEGAPVEGAQVVLIGSAPT